MLIEAKKLVDEVLVIMDNTDELTLDKAGQMRMDMSNFNSFQKYYPVVVADLRICRAYASVKQLNELRIMCDYVILKLEKLFKDENY